MNNSTPRWKQKQSLKRINPGLIDAGGFVSPVCTLLVTFWLILISVAPKQLYTYSGVMCSSHHHLMCFKCNIYVKENAVYYKPKKSFQQTCKSSLNLVKQHITSVQSSNLLRKHFVFLKQPNLDRNV